MAEKDKAQSAEVLYAALGVTRELRERKRWNGILRRVSNEEGFELFRANRKPSVKVAARAAPPDPKNGELGYDGVMCEGYDLYGRSRGPYQLRLDDRRNGKVRNQFDGQDGAERYINTSPGALRPNDTLVLTENFPSLYAVTASADKVGRRNIKVADLNGLPGWLVHYNGKEGPSEPSRDLALAADHDVIVVPDPNVWQAGRADLMELCQRLDAALRKFKARSVRWAKLDGDKDGPDKLIPQLGDKAFWAVMDRAQPLWQYAFPSVQEFDDEDLTEEMLIEHLLADRSITIVTSPSENYKTTMVLHWCKALCLGRGKVHNYFEVKKGVSGVVYCCPDMSRKLLIKYARQVGLNKLPNQPFRIRTMQEGPILYPDNPLIIEAARAGCFLVFDTLNYFTEATDDNNPQELNAFIVKCRVLIDRYGAAGVLVLAHPTKSGIRSGGIDVVEWVSGTYAKIGNVDTIFCMKKIPLSDVDPTAASVYVTREKGRPFLGVPCLPFTLSIIDGRGNCLDRGEMPVRLEPGEAKLAELMPERLKPGRKPDPQKDDKLAYIESYIASVLNNPKRKSRPTSHEIADALNRKYETKHDEKTVRLWLKGRKQDKQLIDEFEQELPKKEEKKRGKAKR